MVMLVKLETAKSFFRFLNFLVGANEGAPLRHNRRIQSK